LQILFINLLNDSFPAIALGLEKAEPTVMDRPPRDMNEGIFGGGLFAGVVTRGALIGIAAILAQYLGMTRFSPEMGGAMAFTTLILARTLQTFSSRSNSQTALGVGLFSNLYVLGAVGICFLLYGITLLPGAREVFYIPAAFGLRQWAIAAGLALGAVLVMEAVKWVRNKTVT
jgi:Ca2+-transporting ATPase